MTAVAVLPLALVPLTFAYAILRYKLWDIEVIVRDTISSTLTLLLGIIGFSLVNLAIDRGLPQELALARNLLSFVAGLGIAGLLVPTRRGISSLLERLQYRRHLRQAPGPLRPRPRAAPRARPRPALRGAAAQIEEALALERANLYLAQGGHADGWCARSPGLPVRLSFDALGEERLGRSPSSASPGSRCRPSRCRPPSGCSSAGYRYAFPLTVRGSRVGLVLAGYKRGQAPLNSEDIGARSASCSTRRRWRSRTPSSWASSTTSSRRWCASSSYSEGIFESSPAGIAVLDGGRSASSRPTPPSPRWWARERGTLLGRALAEVLPVEPLPAPGEGSVEVELLRPPRARAPPPALARRLRARSSGPAAGETSASWWSTTSPSGWRWRTR